MIIDDDGEINESAFNQIAEKLKIYLIENYQPVHNPGDPETMHFTTSEIFSKLQSIVPSDSYTIEDVALWLDNGGFTFADYGDMRLEWMMKRK